MDQTSVTVVIPTRAGHGWPTLVRAVASARSQTHRPAEVVVVVDHDTAHFHRVRRDLAGVTVLENAYGKGVTGSRNTGAYHATTPLIAFLDDTATADPHWLASLVPAFADPAVVGAGTAVRRTTFREVGGFRYGTDTDLPQRMTALDGGRWHHPPTRMTRHDRPAYPRSLLARTVGTRLAGTAGARETAARLTGLLGAGLRRRIAASR